MNPDPGNDSALLQSLQQGQDTSLNQLIARWQRPLFSFAWRYVRNATDAEDLVAEVFVRLYKHRLQLEPDSNLAAWLFTTLTNLCHNHHRWRGRHPTVSLDATGEYGAASPATAAVRPAEGPSPDHALEQEESMAALAAAIERLPHELKVTLLLHHYEHLSYREIGAITKCSERGVETRLYRARQRLRADLTSVLGEALQP